MTDCIPHPPTLFNTSVQTWSFHFKFNLVLCCCYFKRIHFALKSFLSFLFGSILVLSFLHAVVGEDAADSAIKWEAKGFKEHAAPYPRLCLGFVRDAYAHAGVPKEYLDQGSAKEGCIMASKKAHWNKYTTHDVPCCSLLGELLCLWTRDSFNWRRKCIQQWRWTSLEWIS
jgi:hypothetical protein